VKLAGSSLGSAINEWDDPRFNSYSVGPRLTPPVLWNSSYKKKRRCNSHAWGAPIAYQFPDHRTHQHDYLLRSTATRRIWVIEIQPSINNELQKCGTWWTASSFFLSNICRFNKVIATLTALTVLMIISDLATGSYRSGMMNSHRFHCVYLLYVVLVRFLRPWSLTLWLGHQVYRNVPIMCIHEFYRLYVSFPGNVAITRSRVSSPLLNNGSCHGKQLESHRCGGPLSYHWIMKLIRSLITELWHFSLVWWYVTLWPRLFTVYSS